MSLRYAVVDRTTRKVINVIMWDGVSNISFITKDYDVVPAHRPDKPDEYYGDIGDYHNPTTNDFERPVTIVDSISGRAVLRTRISLSDLYTLEPDPENPGMKIPRAFLELRSRIPDLLLCLKTQDGRCAQYKYNILWWVE
jgi:hypothetical protein